MTLEKLKKSWKDPTFLAFVVLIVAWIGTMLFIPGFNTWNHNMTFLKTAAYVGMIVIGQGICIISGGIDLSVSNVVTLSSVVAAGCAKDGGARSVESGCTVLFSKPVERRAEARVLLSIS